MKFSLLLVASLGLATAACGSDSQSDPASGTGGSAGVSGTGGGAGTGSGAGFGGSAGVVGTTVADDLTFLREEEKLARDVYLTLYDTWKLMPHQNISKSEQTHMDSVKVVLDTYGLEDPVKDDTVGVFTSSELAKLYTDLVALGNGSEVDSLRAGATIEDLDIRDIEAMRASATEADVLSMYDSLQCGSRNHMRSFYSQLQQRGETYEAQYITAQELADIVGSAKETCNQ
ncbi:MAG: DUF2202 domain-containing protein [Myxococcales bacterium]|nr:DUF2202 domain-containing protein [Myxococcales bacterium]MCB9579438.1 DUF2202 domain-containing protein [Polyangiaceae bacterium]